MLALSLAGFGQASDILDVSPVTNQIVMIHFKDGHVVHHKLGQARSEETVVQTPLDVELAGKPLSYGISSTTDPAYRVAKAPVKVGRKSKGTDFSWHIDNWVGDHAENKLPDHTKEHWLYLFLPSPMKPGASYAISTGALAANGRAWTLIYDERKARSEAVHVNTIGYVPSAPAKFAYVYHWAGDQGSLDLRAVASKRFRLVDQATGKDAFEGKVTFRAAATNPETQNVGDSPGGNFLDADVYECDFSGFSKPGRYVVAVEGVGCSWPFLVAADAYREAFRNVTKGLFYQRSGIALTKPYSVYERPAPGHPGVTPGFKLQYSSLASLDYGSESGTKAQIDPTLKGPLDAWGWYQDAGDWDGYVTHLRVAQELMMAFELNPKAFTDGELNIPESGNGIPDILDEAAWLPRFGQRLRAELLAKHYGTGGIGLRIAGDAYGGDTKANDFSQGSWQDVDRLYVASGEDAVSTYRYAGAAAQLAHCLSLAQVKDPKGVDWAKEARESYAWAAAHSHSKDENELRPARIYAAAALFRLTGETAYQDQVRKDAKDAPVWQDDLYGPAIYAFGGAFDSKRDPVLLERIRTAILATADREHESAVKRALRWGGDWGFPMLIGQQTTPWVLEIAVARALTKVSDPAKSKMYEADLYTTCDYFLGTNALNMTWSTGLGPRHPNMVFHMDSWYLGDGSPHPGTVPYGPWRKEKDQGPGPWDHDWVNKTVYPKIDLWPGNERWFDDRCAPLLSEYTIHQNIAPSAAIFGILCGEGKPPTTRSRK